MIWVEEMPCGGAAGMDPSALFAIIFGSEQFDDLIGELKLASKCVSVSFRQAAQEVTGIGGGTGENGSDEGLVQFQQRGLKSSKNKGKYSLL